MEEERAFAEIAAENGVLLSDHALLRLRQRGLSAADVAYILNYGVCEQMASATIYYLRAIDVAGEERQSYQRLVGSAVITAPDSDRVITVWRNRKHGTRNLRRKRGQRRNLTVVRGEASRPASLDLGVDLDLDHCLDHGSPLVPSGRTYPFVN